jgi:hypothetical protein
MTAFNPVPADAEIVAKPAGMARPGNRAEVEQRVVMRVSVEADSLVRVQQAVVAACGRSVQFLRTQAVPRSKLVWVWLALAEAAVPIAMHATIYSVSYGEIGRIVKQGQEWPRA